MTNEPKKAGDDKGEDSWADLASDLFGIDLSDDAAGEAPILSDDALAAIIEAQVEEDDDDDSLPDAANVPIAAEPTALDEDGFDEDEDVVVESVDSETDEEEEEEEGEEEEGSYWDALESWDWDEKPKSRSRQRDKPAKKSEPRVSPPPPVVSEVISRLTISRAGLVTPSTLKATLS